MATSVIFNSILIVTVTKVEAKAVLDAFSRDAKLSRVQIGNKTYYDLGSQGGKPIYMVRSEMGALTPGGAFPTIRQAIQDLHPQAIVMCGIAFGMYPDEQQLGDILIAKQILCYDLQKVDAQKGLIPRGDRATASESLIDRFRSGDMDWLGVKTHFGLLLSGQKLINDPVFLKLLKEIEPEAIGGEMEGVGLYIAARDAKVDWILVKAICDWADGTKNDFAQELAARNAAQFLFHVLHESGWSETSSIEAQEPVNIADTHKGSNNEGQAVTSRQSPQLIISTSEVAEKMVFDVLQDRSKEVFQQLEKWETQNSDLHEAFRDQLLIALRNQQISLLELARVGSALARLGDPRFRSDCWYLPDENYLGFIKIPAGKFMMGLGIKEDQPHEVEVSTFYISRYPVTIAQYQAYLNDITPSKASEIKSVDSSNHPVVNITWNQAMDYCNWLNERLRRWVETPKGLRDILNGLECHSSWRITLPSEVEWEKAARGMNDFRNYPWGNDISPEKANYKKSGLGSACSVGCFGKGASPYGLLDMSGNVWEWTRSIWGDNPNNKVLKGGSFYDQPYDVQCSSRLINPSDQNFNHIGFRTSISEL